jgi:hypothetical protein
MMVGQYELFAPFSVLILFLMQPCFSPGSDLEVISVSPAPLFAQGSYQLVCAHRVLG